jgi:pimeloyl-ACP methyl ester carboxylesterase
MKKHLFTTLTFVGLIANSCKCQTIDTLLDVGGYRLNFHIIKGTEMPILFEGGSGADVTVWDNILKPIADITHATLITYDRAGFGKSELDTSNHDLDKHGILKGIEGLEMGLRKLGYDKVIMLIAHSFGGFCATLFAARHPSTVKSAVLFDCNHVCWFTDDYVNSQMKERIRDSAEIKKHSLAYYYQSLNLQNTVELMKKSPFPPNVPVIDLVADYVPAFPDSAGAVRWKACHRKFADAQPQREGVTANGCAHFIFRDNRPLAITAVVKAYAGTLQAKQRGEMMNRFLSFNLHEVNDEKKKEVQYRHSMDDLVSWGRSLLQQGEKEKAIEVLKLNVLLYPANTDVYESLAEAYEAAGNMELAIKNYKKSLQLDPNNMNAERRIKNLLPPPIK